MKLTDYEHLVKELFVASSAEGAVAYLATHNGHALPVAGATQVLPDLLAGEYQTDYLVDVSHVCSMQRILQEDGHVLVGGSVTFAKLGASELIAQAAPLLHEAGILMGNEDIRQHATIGGNVAAAVGNADGAVALMALGAEVEIANLTGSQWLSVDSLFVGRGALRIDSATEIITGFRVPVWQPAQGEALERLVTMPHTRPDLSLAVALSVELDHTLNWVSIVVGGLAGIPMHLRELERDLLGQAMDDPATLEMFTRTICDQVVEQGLLGHSANDPITDELCRLVQRAYSRARERTRASLQA